MSSYEAVPLIGREHELALIQQVITDQLYGAPPQQRLLNLVGAYGLGKSVLLDAVAQQISPAAKRIVLRLSLPTTAPAARAPTPEDCQLVLRQLALALEAPDLAGPVPDSATADGLLQQAAELLLAQAQHVILLLDAEPSPARVVFGWIERGLLLPLTRAERLVAVIASRTPLRWRQFETRRRARLIALGPLDLAQTAQQLELSLADAAPVYALTGGVPFANQAVRQLLADQPTLELHQQATQQAMVGQISQQFYRRVSPPLTNELRCMLATLAVVREFALPLVQQLLPLFCAEHPLPTSPASLLVLIKQLQDLELVIWDQTNLAFQIVPEVRHLLAAAQRVSNLDRVRAIQRQACSYYRETLTELLIAPQHQLAELLWHTLDCGEPNSLQPTSLLHELLSQYLSSPDGRHVDHAAVQALRERLAADHELATTLERYQTEPAALLGLLDQRLNASAGVL